jgi:multiple sugar transport system substrate-binding protein
MYGGRATMIILTFNTEYSEERFLKEIAEPVEKKFPHIKLQYRAEDPNLVGAIPDIHLLHSPSIYQLIESKLCMDLRELEKCSVDLDSFETGLLSYGYGHEGELFAVPYNNAMEYPLFYNKDIFDRFGAPYPRDGMTWSEIIELAPQVTGDIEGTHYYGLDAADYALMKMQLSASILDPLTGQAAVNKGCWKKIAHTLKAIYAIKGNRLPERSRALRFNGYFVRDQVVAMGVICAVCFGEADLNFNWDIVSYPVFDDSCAPNLWSSMLLSISSSSENKDTALEIVSYLVSDEFQRINCKNGIMTSLNKQDIQQHFGEHMPIYRNKNIRALYYNRPAIPDSRGSIEIMDRLMYKIYENSDLKKTDPRSKLIEMIYDDLGVEETLQELELEINKALEEYRINSNPA